MAELAIKRPPLHFGEPEHGTLLGAVANVQGLAQRSINPRGGLVGRELGK